MANERNQAPNPVQARTKPLVSRVPGGLPPGQPHDGSPAHSPKTTTASKESADAKTPLPEPIPPPATSLWRPVLTKAASMSVGILVLAAVGMVSTWHAAEAGVAPHTLQQSLSWVAGGPLLPMGSSADSATESALASSGDQPNGNGTSAQEGAAPDNAQSPPPRTNDGTSDTTAGSPETGAAGAGESGAADGGAPPTPPPGVTPDGKVILNTADSKQLQQLPGVGEKRAEQILALRERLGRFKRPTDLLRVRGIGIKSLRKMLPHLVLDPPE